MLTILMDQDGPLADFDGAFYALCEERGWAMHSTLETQCHRFATDCVLDERDAAEARRWINEHPRWFHDLPPVPGAVDGMRELMERCNLWIVTKPLEDNVNCRDGKAEWVRTHLGPEFERRLILAPDKSMVAGHVLVDDAPKPHWFLTSTWDPIIFPTPWNGEGSDWSTYPRWTWADGVDRLLELAETSCA